MANDDKICPKCNRTMEIGFITDVAYGAVFQSSWLPGIPVVRRFVGGVKWRQQDCRHVVTYRCSSCGFLESYAAE